MQTLARLLTRLWSAVLRSIGPRPERPSRKLLPRRSLCEMPMSLAGRAPYAVGPPMNPPEPPDIAFTTWMYFLN